MKLIVRLSKPGRTIRQLLKDGHGLKGPITPWGGIEDSALYYGRAYANDPSWEGFVSSGTNEPLDDLHNEGSVALIFVPVEDRFLVYSFGHTISKLNIAPFERDFGLKVVLNKIDPKKLKSIDSKTIDAVITNKRTQLSKENKIDGFGFEIDKDMLRSVAGKANEDSFGSMLSGSDSLTVSCKIVPAGVAAKSGELLAAYRSNNYQQNYRWIDNIQPVKDEPIIAELNKKLLVQVNKSLKGRIDPALQLASPEVIDFENIDHFRVKGYKSREEFSLPEVTTLLKDMEAFNIDEVELDNLERYRIEAVDGNDATVSAWPVYDWLITEVSHNRKHYVLSEGTWFVISSDFLKKINDSFANLIADVNEYTKVGTTADKNEREYLASYAESVGEIILDRGLFQGYGPHDTIEICDIFNRSGDFVHIKDGGASSKLSHLFNQGYVSASTLISDRQFRQGVVDKLHTKPALAALIKDPVVAADHTVAYRILKSGKMFSLPFFSKVVLREMHRKIKMMGFKFRLEWVQKK